MVGRGWHCNKSLAILHIVMLNDVYNKQILGFAADIPRQGRLEGA
jgi:hypothetical protein